MSARGGSGACGDDALIRQAMEWFERVHGDDVDTELLAEWQRWLADSDAHQQAFRRIEDFWRAAGAIQNLRLPSRRELKNDSYDGSIPVAEWRASQTAAEEAITKARRFGGQGWRFFSRRRLYLLVAAVAVIAVLAALFHRLQLQAATPAFSVFETGHGEHREVKLADGSKVLMGARSSVSVNYTDTARNVVVDCGEAFFTVVSEKSWPFIVRAGVGTITAVGTAFNVQNVQGRVVVSVTEGSVDVANVGVAKAELTPVSAAIASPAPPPITRVRAGQQVAYGKGATAVEPTDSEAVVAWRAGRLKYRGEALKFVIPDVARYTEKQLVIADPAVGELRFTGTVFQDEVDDWLASLGEAFPIELMRIDAGTVVLRTRQPEIAGEKSVGP